MRPLGRVVIIAVAAFGHSAVASAAAPGHGGLTDSAVRLLVPMFVAWWAEHDARRTRYWPAYHYGLWLFYAWPVAVPHYVLHTRGWRGWPLSALLLAALLSPFFGHALGHGLRALADASAP